MKLHDKCIEGAGMEKNLAVNAIRILSADAVQKAKSGHPGFPLGAAPIVYELFANHLKHDLFPQHLLVRLLSVSFL